MTRPTRSGVSRRLDDLDGGRGRDAVGLITVLSTVHNSGDVEVLDFERRLWRLDGDEVRLTDHAHENVQKLVGGSA